MKKIIAILSVVLFSFGVAKAGELSVTGSAKASYAVTSSDGTAASNDSAKGLGIENEFTLGASGELDNGYTWSYAVDIDSVESSATNDDAKLTLTTPIGTIGMFLGEGGLGVDNAASQSVVARPSDTSFNEQMTDTYDIDGYDNIQYHTPADMLPFGITAKIGYAPSGLATAANDFTATGATNNRLATTDSASAGGIVLHAGGSSVSHYQVKAAPIDGLNIGADYFEASGVLGSTDQAPESGAYFATYAFGPATVGYQINDEDDSATGGTDYETEIYAISFMVNENFSISYGEHNTEKSGTSVDQEAESVQASYSMGGMTINLKDSEMSGVAHTATNTHETTEVMLVFAF